MTQNPYQTFSLCKRITYSLASMIKNCILFSKCFLYIGSNGKFVLTFKIGNQLWTALKLIVALVWWIKIQQLLIDKPKKLICISYCRDPQLHISVCHIQECLLIRPNSYFHYCYYSTKAKMWWYVNGHHQQYVFAKDRLLDASFVETNMYVRWRAPDQILTDPKHRQNLVRLACVFFLDAYDQASKMVKKCSFWP